MNERTQTLLTYSTQKPRPAHWRAVFAKTWAAICGNPEVSDEEIAAELAQCAGYQRATSEYVADIRELDAEFRKSLETRQ
jgi:hypothetical protein